MMGAYGCALHAIAACQSSTQLHHASLDDLLRQSACETRLLNCKGCENQCLVTMYRFGSGRRYYFGTKCERVFNNQGKNHDKGENIYREKYEPVRTLRLSTRNFGMSDGIESIPLYAAVCLKKGGAN